MRCALPASTRRESNKASYSLHLGGEHRSCHARVSQRVVRAQPMHRVFRVAGNPMIEGVVVHVCKLPASTCAMTLVEVHAGPAIGLGYTYEPRAAKLVRGILVAC